MGGGELLCANLIEKKTFLYGPFPTFLYGLTSRLLLMVQFTTQPG